MTNTELGYMEASDKPSPLAPVTVFSTGHGLKQTGKYSIISSLKHARANRGKIITEGECIN